MVRATAPAETTARTIPEATIAVLSPVEGLFFLVVVVLLPGAWVASPAFPVVAGFAGSFGISLPSSPQGLPTDWTRSS